MMLKNKKVKNVVKFFEPLTTEETINISQKQKKLKSESFEIKMMDDEIVEDAGLDHDPEKETVEQFKSVINR